MENRGMVSVWVEPFAQRIHDAGGRIAMADLERMGGKKLNLIYIHTLDESAVSQVAPKGYGRQIHPGFYDPRDGLAGAFTI
jgi:hypothetical protein